MPLIVRKINKEDLSEVCRMYLELYYGDNPMDPVEKLPSRMNDYCLLAELDGEIAGFVIANVESIEFMKSEIGRSAFPGEKEYLEVQELFVKKEHRNKNIGAALMQNVLETGRKNGIRKSMVYSGNADYIRTAGFYEKCGYRMWHIFMTRDI